MCTFRKPFNAESVEELEKKILEDKVVIPQGSILSTNKDLQGIIQKLLWKNPDTRPSVNDIFAMPIIVQKAHLYKYQIPQ